MHHESELSDEMKEAIRKAQELSAAALGATGRFPDGKLTPNDEGELAFQVGALKGKVILNFGQPVASLGLSPTQARELAKTLRLWANRAIRPSYQ